MRAYANALEIIPFTLAENAGLNPIQVSCYNKVLRRVKIINKWVNIILGEDNCYSVNVDKSLHRSLF